jgi:hypothetical protein
MAAIEPLSVRERWILAIATAITAATRLLPLALTPWDWDELLFMRALDHFDVSTHNPHPPGFPLYVLAGKVVRKFGFGNFHALQAVNVIGAMLIVPLMFFLCRELGMRFWTALSAAMLLAFFPNVWFFGGTAFSDVPSMTLVIAACALLLAGRRSGTAYLLGAVMLAIAAGFRPQNLLVGFAPMLMASWSQLRQSAARVVVAVGLLAAIVGISYGIAAGLTGWTEYREAVQSHEAYIRKIDSFLSPTRPPLWQLFDDFFMRPYRAPIINIIITIFCVVGLLRFRPGVRIALAAFGPLCIVSWLMLDYLSVSRFSIGYAPLIAILAADGLQFVARRFEPYVAAAVVLIMVVWTWPAFAVVRSTMSPPVEAINWIRNHVDRKASTIYVHGGMIPYAEWYLSDYSVRYIANSPPPPSWTARIKAYYLREGLNAPGAEHFGRPRGRLWDIVRRRYFDVGVQPISEMMVFGDGWYWEEGDAAGNVWRWMQQRSEITLPPAGPKAHLRLSLYAPLDALPRRPNVVVRLNGAVIDSYQPAKSTFDRDLIVPARTDATNSLVIETDEAVRPASRHLNPDTRILGLRLNAIGWATER